MVQDLEGVRAINADKKRVLAETQARCGEVLSDLQQKRATLAESQVSLSLVHWQHLQSYLILQSMGSIALTRPLGM